MDDLERRFDEAMGTLHGLIARRERLEGLVQEQAARVRELEGENARLRDALRGLFKHLDRYSFETRELAALYTEERALLGEREGG